jgi:hypothetical protein
MAETYEYKGQIIEVKAFRKTSNPETWEPLIFITGVRHLLTATGDPRKQLFSTEAAAIEYGKKAAESQIDHPIRTQ